jgi:hypothetical protein
MLLNNANVIKSKHLEKVYTWKFLLWSTSSVNKWFEKDFISQVHLNSTQTLKKHVF